MFKLNELYKSSAIFAAAAVIGGCSTVEQFSEGVPSAWDKQQTEIEQRVTLPINYPQAFSRERHLYGYNPRFMPGSISFTTGNRPVIRFGVQGMVGEYETPVDGRTFTAENYIQYLGDNGKWYTTAAHVQAVRKHLKLNAEDELLVHTGNRVYERVEFDLLGDAYTMIDVKAKGKWYTYLLYSADNMKNWQVISLPAKGNWRIESYQTNNLTAKPPVIVSGAKSKLMLLIPEKREGKLVLPEAVTLPGGSSMVFHGVMSGAGNHSITVNSKTFVVYLSMKAHPGHEGTPQYIVSYDHRTGKTEGPVFLGTGGHRVDGHNSPVIVADSKAHLHVLLGTHWHSMVHCISEKPADISAWQKPLYVAGNGDNSWSRNGITYPGFTIDKDDTLHLAVRGRNSRWVKNDAGNERVEKGYPDVLDYALVYLRKTQNGDWEPRRDLVRPSHMAYSNWYQKIAIDRKGTPYLNYTYYAHNLTPREKLLYIFKWGGTGENKAVTAHDPVLIRTTDSGDSWSIVTTDELYESMK